MTHDTWCPDCDDRTAVVDSADVTTDADGTTVAWATCTECGIGWVHRDELPETVSAAIDVSERRAA